MKTRFFFPLLLIAALGSAAFSEHTFNIKEVRITPKGTLLGVVITLHTFDILIDADGTVADARVTVHADGPLDYRFLDDKIEKIQKGLIEAEYDGNKLVRVGDFDLRYESSASQKVVSIGDTLISYRSFDGKAGPIERIGSLEFTYSLPERYLETIGSLKFEYRRQDGNLERFTRVFAKEKEPVFGIRVLYTGEQRN